ncbi:unnamed protein product [Nesidiocoris tenuis]|uniref:Uncharacterized protein n=1 Tax=Nesidiocoris tenuis TaxID=355587 RepID=A0A6H5HZ05_9HEMI|nr:unnamed protein product [Nesidiocoris tenuis]
MTSMTNGPVFSVAQSVQKQTNTSSSVNSNSSSMSKTQTWRVGEGGCIRPLSRRVGFLRPPCGSRSVPFRSRPGRSVAARSAAIYDLRVGPENAPCCSSHSYNARNVRRRAIPRFHRIGHRFPQLFASEFSLPVDFHSTFLYASCGFRPFFKTRELKKFRHTSVHYWRLGSYRPGIRLSNRKRRFRNIRNDTGVSREVGREGFEGFFFLFHSSSGRMAPSSTPKLLTRRREPRSLVEIARIVAFALYIRKRRIVAIRVILCVKLPTKKIVNPHNIFRSHRRLHVELSILETGGSIRLLNKGQPPLDRSSRGSR